MKDFITLFNQLAGSRPWLEPYHLLTVVNPLSGGFNNKKDYKKRLKALQHFVAGHTSPAESRPVTSLIVSDYGDFTRYLPQLKQDAAGKPVVIFVLGGDGMASEVIQAVNNSKDNLAARTLLLLAPMGTGNDGASAPHFKQFLQLLLDGKGHRKQIKLIRVDMPHQGPRYAFNIVSLGLDAFVTHVTNKVKLKFPGNFYKIMIDLAALCYGWFYKILPSHITAIAKDGTEIDINEKLTLFCIGYEGGARYGGGKCVIPGDENVCALSDMSTLSRIIYKNRIATGRHRHLKYTKLFTSKQIVYDYKGTILLNTDGETIKLQPENFPLNINIIEGQSAILKMS